MPCPGRGEALDAAALATQFNREHERMYGYSTPEFARPAREPAARRDRPHRAARRCRASRAAARAGAAEPRELRQVYFTDDGWIETPIYTVDGVLAGDELPGPSILEDPRSTMLILPGQRGVIDELRNLHIHEVEGDPAHDRHRGDHPRRPAASTRSRSR